MLSTCELFFLFCSCSLGFYGGLSSLPFSLSESLAVGCVQHSFLHLTPPDTYVAKGQPRCPPRPPSPRNVVSLLRPPPQSAVTFDSTFLFEAPPLFAWVTSRTRLCHIDDPRSFTLRIYPLDSLCMLWEHGCEKYTECIFKVFTTRLSLFREKRIDWWNSTGWVFLSQNIFILNNDELQVQ